MSGGLPETVLIVAALGAAALALAGEGRLRPAAALVALVLAPALVAAENWDSAQFSDLRGDPPLLVAALAGLGVLVAALAFAFRRRPAALPVVAIAVLPIRVPVELGGDTSHLLLPLYLVIAAGLLARLEQVGRLRLGERSLWVLRALALVLVLYGVQAAYGPGFSQAAENAGFFFVPFAVLLTVLATIEWDRRLLAIALGIVVVEGMLFTLVAAGQYASGELWWNQKVIEGNQYHEWFRVNSLFWDPNIFGRYLAIAITLGATVLVYATDRRVLVGTFVVSALMVAGLATSFSQSALLALLGGLTVLVAVRWGVGRTAAAIAACVAIVAATLLISGPPDLSEERLEQETSGRVGLIRGGLELAEDEPLTGHGSGSFAREYRQRFDGARQVAVSSHAEPVTIAAEQGAVGFIPYAALLVAAAIALAGGLLRPGPADPSGRPVARVAVLAAFTVMVAHSVAYAAFLTDPITWALLATGLALAREQRQSAAAG